MCIRGMWCVIRWPREMNSTVVVVVVGPSLSYISEVKEVKKVATLK